MGKKEPSQGGASRSQKIFLIIFGLILCLALLEVGLRVGGYIVLFPQNYRNKLSFNNKNTYRILCLGESTTRGQYPSSLEEILNLRHSGLRFSVIDKGRDGTVTSAILNRVESYLGEYHPDMVVAMMGVNDDGNTIFSDAALFLRSFRVYKLMRLLWRNMITNATKMGLYAAHLSGQLVRKNQPGLFDYLPGKQYEGQGNNIENGAALKKELALNPGNDAAYVALGRLYRDQGRLQQAEESFKKSIELNPRNDEAYFWLGQLFRDLWQRQQVDVAQLEQPYQDLWQFRGAEEYIEKTRSLDFNNDGTIYALGGLCFERDPLRRAKEYFMKAWELNPKNISAVYALVRIYRDQGQLQMAEAYTQQALKLQPVGGGAAKLYGALGTIYGERGQFNLAQESYRNANQVRLNECHPTVAYHFLKLKEILDQKKIRLVCVQYPMRNIGPLKKIFRGNMNGVLFVDNEKSFKEVVRKDGFRVYFKDIFGGDFGHCTEKGNRLLAENIANVILKEVFPRQVPADKP